MEYKMNVIEYTDEEILDEFSDIIEDLIVEDYYKTERYAINIIREVLNAGVSRYEHGKILYIISIIASVRNSDNLPGQRNRLYMSSNKKIIETILNVEKDKNEIFAIENLESSKVRVR